MDPITPPELDDVRDETAERIKAMTHEEAIAALDDWMLWDQQMPGFSCTEAEALACLMYRAGVDLARCADLVVRGHGQPGRSEVEGDMHWHGGEPE